LLAKLGALLAVVACIIYWPASGAAYSVLSHEAIIDSAWDTNIKPVLLKRFPDATAEELREAHGPLRRRGNVSGQLQRHHGPLS